MDADIIRMAREAGFLPNANPVMPQLLARFADLVRADERERIKAANAPEIERINAHIKALEEAVAAEREECARACEEYTDNGGGNVEDHEGHGHHLAAILRARGKV